ncbi:oligosaccharide flippase family protein [Marinobacter lipolyticus]|uniref:oligosaccharide flippase family protein n=1 Tax=Marinobacter lipolyticus TaxID=209639 RepID=UPI003A9032FC
MNKKALKAISFLWVGSIAGAGCAFFAQVVLARVLGKSDFGVFAAALATVTLLVPIAGFGVAPFWLKAFGEEGWTARRWWPGSFRFVAVTTLVVMFCLILWAWLGPHEAHMRIVVWLLLFYILGQVVLELVSSKFQLEEKYLALAFWQFLPHFGRLLLVALGAWLFSGVFDVYLAASAYSLVSILVFCAGTILLFVMYRGYFSLQGHGSPISSHYDQRPSTLNVAAEVWPFGAAGLFYLVYFQSAVILLNYLSGAEAAGLYNAAFIIMAAVYLFPSVIYQKFLLPKIHRWANSDRAIMFDTFQKGNVYMFGFGVLAMTTLWLGGWWVLPKLFGQEYSEAVVALNVLALAAPVRFVASSVGSVLVTRKNMKRKVGYMATVSVITVVLNAGLIPQFGILGAATSAVLGDITLLILYFYSARRYVFAKEIS